MPSAMWWRKAWRPCLMMLNLRAWKSRNWLTRPSDPSLRRWRALNGRTKSWRSWHFSLKLLPLFYYPSPFHCVNVIPLSFHSHVDHPSFYRTADPCSWEKSEGCWDAEWRPWVSYCQSCNHTFTHFVSLRGVSKWTKIVLCLPLIDWFGIQFPIYSLGGNTSLSPSRDTQNWLSKAWSGTIPGPDPKTRLDEICPYLQLIYIYLISGCCITRYWL